jgi:hypothetical protein
MVAMRAWTEAPTLDFVHVAGFVCMYVCIIASDGRGMRDEGGNTPKH